MAIPSDQTIRLWQSQVIKPSDYGNPKLSNHQIMLWLWHNQTKSFQFVPRVDEESEKYLDNEVIIVFAIFCCLKPSCKTAILQAEPCNITSE